MEARGLGGRRKEQKLTSLWRDNPCARTAIVGLSTVAAGALLQAAEVLASFKTTGAARPGGRGWDDARREAIK